MDVRVRMAPSPTGFLHVGTARTALFNWLYAKRHGGKLILRIEDTDTARSTPAFEKDIIDQLAWLGITYEEGPFRQSERLDIYEKYLKQLLDSGHAYWCACTKEDLDAQRQAMLAGGIAPRYAGTCRGKKLEAGEGRAIRFVMPEQAIAFADMIRGHISFKGDAIGDIVIAKGLRGPLYNFAVVVDDAEMKITHVIRGEDGIPNTPKQLAIQAALGFAHPHYAHVPLILDQDRAKMSKRDAATALGDYREDGYLPEAMTNFLALLGWHPTDNKEILSAEELADAFDIARVQKAGAVFSVDKLNWINAQYIKAMDDAEIARRLGWEATPKNMKIVALLKNRAQTLRDFPLYGAFFFEQPDYAADLLIWKTMTVAGAVASLERSCALIEAGQAAEIPAMAETHGRGETFWPLRVALSGLKDSPAPLDILDALGAEEALARIGIAIGKLKKNA